MSVNLNDLFPQLAEKQEHFFSEEQFQMMPYFKQLSSILPQKQIITAIKKSKRNFNLLNIKKGTVIYTSGMPSNSAYFLCYGSVTLLIKKSSRQKLQPYPRHILHLVEERINFLNTMFNIPTNKCQSLMNQFYEEKVMFNFLQYQQIYGEGYFGFTDLFKGNSRTFTAIATQDTILLELQKPKFEASLKDLQSKKEDFIIKYILENVSDGNQQIQKASSSINKQISLKMSQIFNYFMVRTYEKDEVIFKENEPARLIYFILRGQIQLKKSFKMEIPKKLIRDENKPQFSKQVQVKVSRLSQKCYFGETQFFLVTKNREFTATALQSSTLLVQIQPNHFMKMISQFSSFEKQLTVSAKQKFYITNENFLKQKNKVIKTFFQQFQTIQNKKKEKILSNLLTEDQANKNLLNQGNSTTFQIFSKQGVFFRDTYEKLEGFEKFQAKQAKNRNAAIRKYKVESSHFKNQNDQNEKQDEGQMLKYPSISVNRGHDQQFQIFDSKQKLLYSPKKNLNILDFISSQPVSPAKQLRKSMTQHESINKIRRKTSVSKFHQLKKDQVVFKRVLIKNGKYEQDKSTFKQNIIKPIVHPHFDDIIKQCMSRKNQVIRKAIGQNKNQFVKDSYQNTIEKLKNKSLSISKFSNFSLTCKGTEQFKKKLQFLNKNHRKSDSTSAIRNRVVVQEQNLHACIGVNQPPKSSYQKTRFINQGQSNKKFTTTVASNNNFGNFSQTEWNRSAVLNNRSSTAFVSKRQSPQKLVLLNHMMKPITYSSVQY